MTTLPYRPHTALIVIDVQTAIVEQAHERDAVVARIGELIAATRARNLPVIWIQHNEPELPWGSPGWEIVPELAPKPYEPVVHKQFRSAFEATNLDAVLAGLGVGHLLLCGAQTQFCVRHTLHAAIERGYDVTLVADAHTTEDQGWDDRVIPASVVIDSLNASSVGYQLPGRTCDVAATAELTRPEPTPTVPAAAGAVL